MKKSLILIVACIFAFATVQAQSSDVEATTQLTKAEQFLAKTTLVKEECIYKDKAGGLVIAVKVFTDLKAGEKIAALEFSPTVGNALLTAQAGGIPGRLGYIDMEHVDDLLLALETILAETNNSSRKDEYSIVYTSPSGIDVRCDFVGGGIFNGLIGFSRKSHYINEYGIWTEYIAGQATMDIKRLSKIINDIKEAKSVALQKLAQ